METPVAKCSGGGHSPGGRTIQEPPGWGRGLRQHLSDDAYLLQRERSLPVPPKPFPGH